MDRAVRLMEEALREARVTAGAEGETPGLMNAMGALYREVGRLDDAITVAREGLALRRAAVPRSAALVGNDVMFLCLALRAKGELAEALALAEEGQALYEEAYGAAHGEARYVKNVVEQLRGARYLVEEPR